MDIYGPGSNLPTHNPRGISRSGLNQMQHPLVTNPPLGQNIPINPVNNQTQMQQGASQTISGPTTPMIFMGHITNSTDHKDVRPDMKVQEIHFGCKIRLEGLHIVPNGVEPPGMAFTGKTKPDMHKGQFFFQLFGRIVSTGEIISIMNLTVNGGVQWVAIPDAFSSLDIDYISFLGSFEEISVILHGTGEGIIDSANNGFLPPYPIYLNQLLSSEDTISPDENTSHTAIENAIGEYRDQRSTFRNLLEVYDPVWDRIEMAFNSSTGQYSVREVLLDTVCTYRPTSLVNLDSVGELIENIFSFNNDELSSLEIDKAIQSRASILSELSDCLGACWECSYISRKESSSSAGSISHILDEEAVAILAKFVTDNFQFLFHVLQNVQVNKPDEEVPVNIDACIVLGNEIFKTIQFLLVNEFTALAFRDCGGYALLLSILRMQPSLPNILMERTLLCILEAITIPKLLEEFIQVAPFGGASSYQELLYLMATWKANSSLIDTAKSILSVCNWYESIHSSKMNISDLLLVGEKVADAIRWRSAADETIPSTEANESEHEITSDDKNVLHNPAKQFMEELDKAKIVFDNLLESWRSCDQCLNEFMSARRSNYLIKDIPSIMTLILHNSNFPQLINACSILVNLLDELENSIDWYFPHLNELKKSRSLFCNYVDQIFELFVSTKHWEVLMCDSPKEMLSRSFERKINSFSSHKRHMMHGNIDVLWISFIIYSINRFIAESKAYLSGKSVESTETLSGLCNVILDMMVNSSTRKSVASITCKYFAKDVISLVELSRSNLATNKSLLFQLIAKTVVYVLANSSTNAYPGLRSQFVSFASAEIVVAVEKLVNGFEEIAPKLKSELMSPWKEIKSGVNYSCSIINQIISLWSNKDFVETKATKVTIEKQLVSHLEGFSLSKLSSSSESTLFLNWISVTASYLDSENSRTMASFSLSFGETLLNLMSNQLNKVLCFVYGIIGKCATGENGSDFVSLIATAKSLHVSSESLLTEASIIDQSTASVGVLIDLGTRALKVAESWIFVSLQLLHLSPNLPGHEIAMKHIIQWNVLCDSSILQNFTKQASSHRDTIHDLSSAYLTDYFLDTTKPSDRLKIMINELFNDIESAQYMEREALFRLFATLLTQATAERNKSIYELLTKTRIAELLPKNLLSSSSQLHASTIDITTLLISKASLATDSAEARDATASIVQSQVDLLKVLCDNYGKQLLDTTDQSAKLRPFFETAVARFLLSLDCIMRRSELYTVLAVTGGLLFELKGSLQGDTAVAISSLQTLVTIYRQCEKLAIQFDARSDQMDPSLAKRSSWALKSASDSVALTLVEKLPGLMRKYQDSPYILQLGIIIIQGMPDSTYWPLFLKNLTSVGEGFTVEFMAIKLWVAFEEAYQCLSEISELRRQLSLLDSTTISSSPFTWQEVQELTLDSVSKFSNAAHSLRSILEMIVWAYEQQLIALSVLSKAARTSLVDVKKVIIRYQRQYAMWANALTNDLMDGSHSKEMAFAKTEEFDARHASISLSLKYLVEISTKITKYNLAREERFSGNPSAPSAKKTEDLEAKAQAILQATDFANLIPNEQVKGFITSSLGRGIATDQAERRNDFRTMNLFYADLRNAILNTVNNDDKKSRSWPAYFASTLCSLRAEREDTQRNKRSRIASFVSPPDEQAMKAAAAAAVRNSIAQQSLQPIKSHVEPVAATKPAPLSPSPVPPLLKQDHQPPPQQQSADNSVRTSRFSNALEPVLDAEANANADTDYSAKTNARNATKGFESSTRLQGVPGTRPYKRPNPSSAASDFSDDRWQQQREQQDFQSQSHVSSSAPSQGGMQGDAFRGVSAAAPIPSSASAPSSAPQPRPPQQYPPAHNLGQPPFANQNPHHQGIPPRPPPPAFPQHQHLYPNGPSAPPPPPHQHMPPPFPAGGRPPPQMPPHLVPTHFPRPNLPPPAPFFPPRGPPPT